jgi:hypothetical protein
MVTESSHRRDRLLPRQNDVGYIADEELGKVMYLMAWVVSVSSRWIRLGSDYYIELPP